MPAIPRTEFSAAIYGRNQLAWFSGLEGLIVGVIVCPEQIPVKKWGRAVFGTDKYQERMIPDLKLEHATAIINEMLARVSYDIERDRYKPSYMKVAKSYDLWCPWVVGFCKAIRIKPKAFDDMKRAPETWEAWDGLHKLVLATEKFPVPPEHAKSVEDARLHGDDWIKSLIAWKRKNSMEPQDQAA